LTFEAISCVAFIAGAGVARVVVGSSARSILTAQAVGLLVARINSCSKWSTYYLNVITKQKKIAFH